MVSGSYNGYNGAFISNRLSNLTRWPNIQTAYNVYKHFIRTGTRVQLDALQILDTKSNIEL